MSKFRDNKSKFQDIKSQFHAFMQCRLHAASMKKQPNLFLGEIDVFFDVIAL